MARLVDYIPEVVNAVRNAGVINQGDLTEAVWGTSGRGNKSLTSILFPEMVSKGLLIQKKSGRSIMFEVTEKGIDKMNKMCEERGYGPCN